jgi:hypothetical protein
MTMKGKDRELDDILGISDITQWAYLPMKNLQRGLQNGCPFLGILGVKCGKECPLAKECDDGTISKWAERVVRIRYLAGE